MILRYALAAAACVAPCLALAEPLPLALRASAAGSFEVVHDRVQPAGAGGAIGGLIGAAIQTGMQSTADDTKTRKILPLLADAACDRPVLEAMAAALHKDGSFAPSLATGETTPAVVVTIHECSLRLVDSVASVLAAYVNLTVAYTGADGAWSEKVTITGRGHHGFDTFLGEAGLAQAELSETLKRAGTRAAHKLIYRK